LSFKNKKKRNLFSSVNLTKNFFLGIAKDKLLFFDWLIIMIGHGDDIELAFHIKPSNFSSLWECGGDGRIRVGIPCGSPTHYFVEHPLKKLVKI
jgi:hypothetical protein